MHSETLSLKKKMLQGCYTNQGKERLYTKGSLHECFLSKNKKRGTSEGEGSMIIAKDTRIKQHRS